jgi:hypothetical protein
MKFVKRAMRLCRAAGLHRSDLLVETTRFWSDL